MLVFSKSKHYMKISKSTMLVSGVLEKCIKTLFFHTGWQLLKQISEPSGISGSGKSCLKKQKDYCFRNYEVLPFFIKYKGIIRNNIEANVQFYRVVRVIPKNTLFKFIKINKIHTNLNDSKLTFRK